MNRKPSSRRPLVLTAAVVGLILNLTVWFALHVLFAKVDTLSLGPLRLSLPDPASLSWQALVLALVAGGLLFVLHRGVMTTLAVCAAVAVGLAQLS